MKPKDVRSRNGQVHVATELRKHLATQDYEDLDFNLVTAAQARLAVFAMLERKEVQQHGRIFRFKIGGAA